MTVCPVCNSSNLQVILERERLPVFQNVVYDTKHEAVSSPSAPFSLAACAQCGFSFNRKFDQRLVVYDDKYNNDVVSNVFEAYYRSIAGTLISKFELDDGHVIDVGCGSGRFFEFYAK